MKIQFNQLGKIGEKLRDKYDKMEEYFGERSDAWLDSEKGSEYEKKIDNVQEAIDNIDYAMSALELIF